MLPSPRRPTKKNTGVYVEESVLESADEIVKAEKLKSRNELLGSFLAFAVELFPLMRPLRARVEEVQRAEGLTYAQAIAVLVERGLGRARK